jgi:hypothetical protein
VDVSRIGPGTVFRLGSDERPCRILIHDRDVAMYDVWWPHRADWGLADLAATRRQRVSYYVATVGTVLMKATYLRSDPLSPDEEATHRPDLPFAAVQDAAATWSDLPDSSGDDGPTLPAAHLQLIPFGPSGGEKRQYGSTRTTGRRSPLASCSARHTRSRAATRRTEQL